MVRTVTVFIGSSWKMTKDIEGARAYASAMNQRIDWPADVQPFILPPTTLLATLRDAIDSQTGILIGAQNAHWRGDGAYTGEVSMRMVRDAGASIVEIGHSERRLMFHETDDIVAQKVRAAVTTGLTVLLCVGETRSTRERGEAEAYVENQVTRGLEHLAPAERRRVMVAYEPIWSIGDDGTPADPHDVARTIGCIRACGVGPVLYGGSVHVGNARQLLVEGDADGLFVGRAAWTPEGFQELVDIGGEVARDRRRTPLRTEAR